MGLLHLRLPAVSNGSAVMPGRTCTKAAPASARSATERARGGAHCHGLDNLRAAAREHAHRRELLPAELVCDRVYSRQSFATANSSQIGTHREGDAHVLRSS